MAYASLTLNVWGVQYIEHIIIKGIRIMYTCIYIDAIYKSCVVYSCIYNRSTWNGVKTETISHIILYYSYAGLHIIIILTTKSYKRVHRSIRVYIILYVITGTPLYIIIYSGHHWGTKFWPL